MRDSNKRNKSVVKKEGVGKRSKKFEKITHHIMKDK
jgi:hypothetical protein